MQRHSSNVLITFCLLLSACSTSHSARSSDMSSPNGTVSPTTARVAETAETKDIAMLLHQRPAPSVQVALDVYNWVGDYREASYDFDPHHCPLLANESLLTDQPVVGFITTFNSGQTNWLSIYPPDDDAWLVPTFAAQKMWSYPPPDEHAMVPRTLGFHLRLQGHLDDAYFAHCAHADRIFVIERIITIYSESEPQAARPFGITLPADFSKWQRYQTPGRRLHFPYRAGWAITPFADPTAKEALTIQMSEWPLYPITIRVFDTNAGQLPDKTGGEQLDIRLLRQRLGLPENGQAFVAETYTEDISAYTKRCTVLLTRDATTYELNVSYPFGLHADGELLVAFTALVAGFEVDT